MLESRVLDRVRGAMSAVLPLGVVVEIRERPGGAAGYLAVLQAGKVKHRAVVGWAGEGWPADVERLLALASDVDVVVARDLSIGAREWLADRGLGWVDEVGRASVSLPTGLVVVRDVADPPRAQPADGWTHSSVAVAEAILSGIEPRVDSIEGATGLSRGAAAKALSMLERGGLLRRDARRGPGSARRVENAQALLEEYATTVAALDAKSPRVLLHRVWRDPVDALIDELGPALDLLGATWAATGAAAAALMAPYLSRFTVVELYVDAATISNRANLCDAVKARQVERGHRIEVRTLPNRITAMAGPVVDGVRCASPARVYADLLAIGGRSAEAAQHVREVLHVGADSEPPVAPARRDGVGSRRHRLRVDT